MSLGRKLGLGPGHIVLDGDPAPPPPKKGPCLLWPNVWMDQDATWYEGRPRPGPHCVRSGSSSPIKEVAQPPIFGPCLLWKNGRPSQLLLSTCSWLMDRPMRAVGHSVCFRCDHCKYLFVNERS